MVVREILGFFHEVMILAWLAGPAGLFGFGLDSCGVF